MKIIILVFVLLAITNAIRINNINQTKSSIVCKIDEYQKQLEQKEVSREKVDEMFKFVKSVINNYTNER